MKTLLLDIEIAPVLATVWGIFKPFININNIVGESYVLCWAAKWHGSDEVIYSSLSMTSRKNMIKEMYKLLEEADEVVTYNGDRFDLKILNQEFMYHFLPPPAPYKSTDLLKTMKRRFRGTSNKLDYWLKYLDLGAKVKHRGPQLWLDCMSTDKAVKAAAFEEMEEYNIGDVTELEKLYDRVRAWIVNAPNRSVFEQDLVCTHCGGTHYQKRGTHKTNAGLYQRYQCQEDGCGGWFSGNKNLAQTEKFRSI